MSVLSFKLTMLALCSYFH